MDIQGDSVFYFAWCFLDNNFAKITPMPTLSPTPSYIQYLSSKIKKCLISNTEGLEYACSTLALIKYHFDASVREGMIQSIFSWVMLMEASSAPWKSLFVYVVSGEKYFEACRGCAFMWCPEIGLTVQLQSWWFLWVFHKWFWIL